MWRRLRWRRGRERRWREAALGGAGVVARWRLGSRRGKPSCHQLAGHMGAGQHRAACMVACISRLGVHARHTSGRDRQLRVGAPDSDLGAVGLRRLGVMGRCDGDVDVDGGLDPRAGAELDQLPLGVDWGAAHAWRDEVEACWQVLEVGNGARPLALGACAVAVLGVSKPVPFSMRDVPAAGAC